MTDYELKNIDPNDIDDLQVKIDFQKRYINSTSGLNL